MDFDDIEQILELVREHDLAEFELERDGLKLRVRRRRMLRSRCSRDARSSAAPCRRCQSPARAAAADARPRAACRPPTRGRAGAGGRQVADRRHLLPLARSPARRRSSRSASAVKKDQVLCIIEAMKLMNEIKSEYDGEIVSAYVENGKPVQYGERLFAIKTA